MRNIVASALLASTCLILIFGRPSMAQTAQQQKLCANIFGNPIQTISACSALIQAQRLPNGTPLTPKMLAELHFNRGIAYNGIADFERAIADYEKAAPFDARAPRNIYEVKIRMAWLRYLKEIQDDEYDHSNWSSPPFDAFWAVK
jgi:tetratricopeptide (TPR) repeat protein